MAEHLKITRATMALRLEPWRLLPPEAREAHARGHGGDKEAREGCPACQLGKALFDVQRQCAGAYNLAARTLERLDGAFWDEARLAAGGGKLQLPSKKVPSSGGGVREVVAWPSDGLNLYELLRTAFPETIAGTMSAIASEVVQKWRQERHSILGTMERSAARWKRETTPIPLRAADCEIVEAQDSRDLFVLRCSLRSGRKARGKEFEIPIATRDGRQYRDLRAIAQCCAGSPSAFSKMGALEIKRDRLGKHWELRVAYSRQVQRATGDKLGAVNRGIACVLALAAEDGYSYVYDGYDIEAYLAQQQARRRQYQNSLKFSGRRGRGRHHALAPTEVLEGQAARWRKDKLQRIARESARWFKDRGVTRVLLDDLTGVRDGSVDSLDGGKPVWDRIQSWPYFELGRRLEACLDELGIAHESRPVAFGSRDCPAAGCGHRHEERQCSRTFKCSACGYSRHVDVTFALNLIERERSRGESPAAAESRQKTGEATDPRRTSRRARGKSARSLDVPAGGRSGNGEGD